MEETPLREEEQREEKDYRYLIRYCDDVECEKKFHRFQRIKKSGVIRTLIKNGKRWKSNYFTVFYQKNDKNFDCFAVIVSRKHGNAIARNRIKRIYREVFRNTKETNPPFFDIIVSPQYNASINREEIEEVYKKWRKKLKE